jgi:CDP-diacylglycerol--glycerol-3-phosphate 3-phosphatidyltransferase
MSRVFIVPFIVMAMIPNLPLWNAVAAGLFILASITDYFDGYYARKFNAVTNYGKFMDPIADKILVTSLLVMLLFRDRIDPYAVIILVARDNFIGGIRSVAAADQVIIDAKPAGKWKAALQMCAIPALILGVVEWFPYLYEFAYSVTWLSVFLSITSAIDYYRAYLLGRKSH